MSSPGQEIRQRGGQSGKRKEKSTEKNVNGLVAQKSEQIDEVLKSITSTATSEWDYKIAIVIITILAFATRFWGIGHPEQVVFDEVHFGKVRRHPSQHP
jgi:dolichyl-phosphate-mannose-protein mannosyltransferase